MLPEHYRKEISSAYIAGHRRGFLKYDLQRLAIRAIPAAGITGALLYLLSNAGGYVDYEKPHVGNPFANGLPHAVAAPTPPKK